MSPVVGRHCRPGDWGGIILEARRVHRALSRQLQGLSIVSVSMAIEMGMRLGCMFTIRVAARLPAA